MSLFHKKNSGAASGGARKKSNTPFERSGKKAAPEGGRRRNNYYHKYFRGYTEIRKLNAKGRVTIERYYTQPWIVNSYSTAGYWLLRLLYVGLSAVSTGLFVVALIQRIPGNYTWIVALPGYISVMLLFMLLVSTLGYIFVERKMTLWGHHSSTKKLKRYALATSIGQLLTAVALAAVALATRTGVSESLKWAGAILLAAVCSGAMYFVERGVPYKEIPNDTKLPCGEAREIW